MSKKKPKEEKAEKKCSKWTKIFGKGKVKKLDNTNRNEK
jgi:hypothetical protein